MELKKGNYFVKNEAIFITEDQFIWEYKCFNYDGFNEIDNIYMIALEYKTNTTYTQDLGIVKGGVSAIVEKYLNAKTEHIKSKM